MALLEGNNQTLEMSLEKKMLAALDVVFYVIKQEVSGSLVLFMLSFVYHLERYMLLFWGSRPSNLLGFNRCHACRFFKTISNNTVEEQIKTTFNLCMHRSNLTPTDLVHMMKNKTILHI